MMSSLPLAACIGASAAFAGAPVADLLSEVCATGLTTGFAVGFCVTLGDAAVLLDF